MNQLKENDVRLIPHDTYWGQLNSKQPLLDGRGILERLAHYHMVRLTSDWYCITSDKKGRPIIQ